MKISLILSVLLAGTGTVFLHWFDKAQQACIQVSDQCADAGFAWEASGKLLLTAVFLNMLALFLIYLFRSWKKRLHQEKSPES
ncbi:MAG: hypothetical protein QF832_06430 [SAR324 cluster bacterium]|jgi:membrane protein implicated in regulation of membrane protease activity|nr:hypothetical protein [SAR324 cluster bacterium]MDP7332680.1 hypothetical protein [SAR324 cluster bacterium]MDP7502114.1 hypothetical protein [SAR324 cluster bacterium]MDP7608772.1 hypothetical protein [Candidatus Neomarinimicrobiota bacterium]|tara:strand:+ start:95 stop:343 length:249 start_codon:yes stop_codon:yes gene_type:complete